MKTKNNVISSIRGNINKAFFIQIFDFLIATLNFLFKLNGNSLVILTILFFLVGSVNSIHAQLADSPWPMKGHDLKHTGRSQYDGPNVANLKWKILLGFRIMSSPIIGPDRTIYIGSDDDHLYAFNSDGTIKWKFEIGNDTWSTPAIASDGTIYIGSWGDQFYAINSDGTLKWHTQIEGEIISSPAIFNDGTIYFGSGAGSCLYAFNPDGMVKWKFNAEQFRINSSPTVGIDGTIYVGDNGMNFFAINPNGTLKWQYQSKFLHGFESSPSIGSDGTIYIGSVDGLHAFNPDSTLKWIFEMANNDQSSPAISIDGTIYIGSLDDHLYAIKPDGTLKWKYKTDNDVKSSPAIDGDGTIYIGSSDAYFYAINPNGILKWKYLTDGCISSSPAIGADGTIYIAGSADYTGPGYLYAFWTSPSQSIVVSNTSLNFGSVQVGDSKDLGLTISNGGSSSLSVTNITSNLNDFVAFPKSMMLDPDSSRMVTITFTPSSDGYKLATLSIASNDPEKPIVTVSLSGRTPRPIMTVGDTVLNFNSVRVGNSKDLTLTISNEGDRPLIVNSITSRSHEFFVTPTSFIVNENRSQDVQVTFLPSSIGIKSDSLIINSNDPSRSTMSISLSGWCEDLNIYLQPDYTLNETPYDEPGATSWIHNHYVFPPGFVEWKYPLTYNIQGNSCLIRLMAGSVNIEGTNFKAEIILKTSGGESSLGSTTFSGGPAMPWPFQPQRITREIQFTCPFSTIGDTLVFRVTAISDRIGIIAYGEPLGFSYISILDPFRKNVKWVFTTGGISSSPAIEDGTLYIGSWDNKLYAINPDGTEKWSFVTGGDVRSSPAIDTYGTIYVGSFDNKLYAINPDGSEKWSFTTRGDVRSSPAIGSNGMIYVGSYDSSLYAVNPNGTEEWSFFTECEIYSSPAIGTNGIIYVGSRDGKLYAINADGTEEWSFSTNDGISSSPAIGKDSTIYIGSMDNRLYAINPDGTEKWSFSAEHYITSSPTIGIDGTLYVGSYDNKLHAINPDGTEKWSFNTEGDVRSSPAIGIDNTIYVGSYDDKFYVINPDGTEKWSFTTAGNIYSSPTIDTSGMIYVGSHDGKLYAMYSESKGLANSPWPKFRQNIRNTGLFGNHISVINIDKNRNLPKKYLLLQNYPNPFNSKTIIKYQLPKDSQVKLKILNILGQEILILVDKYQKAGNYTVHWDAKNYPSQIYFYLLETDEFSKVRKMILLR